ncbi:hypothetical protein GCM10027020_09660 [Nocardioides salsibiostraticola]
MFCREGHENSPGSAFCSTCGQAFEAMPTTSNGLGSAISPPGVTTKRKLVALSALMLAVILVGGATGLALHFGWNDEATKGGPEFDAKSAVTGTPAGEPVSLITVAGTISLLDADGVGESGASNKCFGDGGFSDLTKGTQVRVLDSSGELLSFDELGQGFMTDETLRIPCVFNFFIPRVPGGEDTYTLEIGSRSILFSEWDADRLRLTLGSDN